MNKERRNRIAEIMDKLNEIADEICEVAQEERDAFDNLPESLQYG